MAREQFLSSIILACILLPDVAKGAAERRNHNHNILAPEWLHGRIYGADTREAGPGRERIFVRRGTYFVHIPNEENFTCRLTADRRGDPAELRACSNPYEDDIPGLVITHWNAATTRIPLHCFNTKFERICMGTYVLAAHSSDGDYESYSEPLTIAHRLH